jgi:hypothetical protein
MFLPSVLHIAMGESIMLCIDSNLCQEQRFILVFTTVLLRNGNCREFVEKIKMLIVEKVDHTLDAKTFTISLNTSKTFLVSYLIHDSTNGTMELFKCRNPNVFIVKYS